MNPPQDPNQPYYSNPQQPNPGYDPNQPQNNPGYNPNYQNWQQNPNPQQQYNPQQPPFQQGYNPQQPYQPYIPPYNHSFHNTNLELPNASNAQICGIVGIVMFWNIIGLILNIVALVMASGAMNEYERMPGRYSQASYNKAKTGKTCGIVGLCLAGFSILLVIIIAVANS